MLALAATCLVVALAAPTAGAASASKSSAESSGGPTATASVTKKRLARDIASVRRRANSNRRTIRTLGATLAALETNLRGAITGGDKTIDDKINGIVAAVTPILGQIGGGLQELAAKTTDGFNKVTDALTQLKTGLEQAGAGLTRVGDFLGATEYGFGQVAVIQPGPVIQPQPGSFIVTPDIPDTVQQSMTHQEFIAQHAGNLAVLYGVRSGENDGDGTTPAAHCRVRVSNGGNTGTTAANAGLGGLPFQPVPDRSALTSTAAANAGFPFGLKQSAAGPPAGEQDKTTTFLSTVPVAAGDRYEVELSCVDLSPNANDPKA